MPDPTTYEIAPEAIFQAEWNYSIDEICELAGIPRHVVEKAAAEREISCVCVRTRDGQGHAWKGAKVAAWIRRCGLAVHPSEIVRRTVAPVKEQAPSPNDQ